MFLHSLLTWWLLEKKKCQQQKSRNIKICFPKKIWVMFGNHIFQHSKSVWSLIKSSVCFLKITFVMEFIISYYYTQQFILITPFLGFCCSCHPERPKTLSFQMSIFYEIFYLPNYKRSLSSALCYNYVHPFYVCHYITSSLSFHSLRVEMTH